MSTNRLTIAVVALLCGVGLVAAACGGSSSSDNSGSGGNVVATVGPQDITRAQLDQVMKGAESQYKSQGQTFPATGSPAYRQLQDKAIALLVQRAEFAEKAKALGIVITPKQVDDRLTQLKKQTFGGSEKRYQDALKTQGFTDAEVRDVIRGQLISEELFKRAEAGVAVSTAAAKSYYHQHQDQYSTPETRVVRHILVKTKAQAEKLYKQIEGGADFAALARKYSQDPGSKGLGGRLTITKGTTVPPFDSTAFSLHTGQVSKPVHSTYGWHVIQALKPIKPRRLTPFSKVENVIKQQLQQQKQAQAVQDWVKQLSQEYCKGKLSYSQGFKPDPDPCASTK